jgi:UDP-N-acetylmuramyl pentapeptide phosphotransferase/UDP-N-acetylglucosamine-1-phosphate transferase
MVFYSLLALCAFLLSLLGTRLMILFLRKRPVLLDIPNLRSNHRLPTPKGGGLVVGMTLVICLLTAGIGYPVILSFLILMAVSLLDDIIGVPVAVRFSLQVVAVSIVLLTMPDLLVGNTLPTWLGKIIIGICWLWFINLFNFMDGIDGLSATEMICIGIGVCFPAVLLGRFPDALSVYGLIITAAASGFIWWNWHPARIFLGDVGSIPIGFLLGFLLLVVAQQGYLYVALILPAYYLSDATLTLLRRIKRREKLWVAHSEHYYQRAIRAGRSHEAVVRYIFGFNLLLILLSTFSVLNPQLSPLYLSLAYLSVFMLLGFFAYSSATADDVF